MSWTSRYRPYTIRRDAMTPEEQIAKMKKAIAQAIKVMSDRFGSTEGDVGRAIDELKASMQTTPVAAIQPSLRAAPVTVGA
jgi:hypothetical protein